MELKDLLVEHDFYASPTNYDCFTAGETYNSWNEFYAEYKDADLDYNLVFRWDLELAEDGETYDLNLIHIKQSKGRYVSIVIINITKENTDEIEQYLTANFQKMMKNWQPISNKFAGYD
jgi:hypothetical protein